MAENVSHLIRFYRGEAPDSHGRMIDDIWAWDHRRLEMVHNYIQWLFPNPAPSRFNPDAPLLTGADIALFRRDDDLRARLRRSLDLMIDFYGLMWSGNGARVTRGPHFAARVDEWLTPTNHNYLRITRIFVCLHLVGMDREAAALFACLDDIAMGDGREAITDRTRDFWKSALEGSAS
jgi:hypothetical protein